MQSFAINICNLPRQANLIVDSPKIAVRSFVLRHEQIESALRRVIREELRPTHV
jgi:hypothetical protein